MERIKSFLKTTFIGGFLVVLPIIILILVLSWFFGFIFENLRPITNLIIQTARLNEFIAALLSVIIILTLFFVVGLLAKTKVGNLTFNLAEEKLLYKIPGYKIIKDTVLQLLGEEKTLFSSVALVNLFGNQTLLTAFITDEHSDGSYTVFVPSGPAPTAGFVYHLKKEYVHKINHPVDQAMRTIISLGAGSGSMIEKYISSKNNPSNKEN